VAFQVPTELSEDMFLFRLLANDLLFDIGVPLIFAFIAIGSYLCKQRATQAQRRVQIENMRRHFQANPRRQRPAFVQPPQVPPPNFALRDPLVDLPPEVDQWEVQREQATQALRANRAALEAQ